MVREFADIDWHSPARQIATLADERERLLATSDVLAQLRTERASLSEEIASVGQQIEAERDALATITARRTDLTERRNDAKAALAEPDAERHLAVRPDVDRLIAESDASLTLRNLGGTEKALRSQLHDRIDATDKRIRSLRESNFQSQLSKQTDDIRDRIDDINTSLVQIDFNPGRYISLEPTDTNDPEIRDFRRDLRACTEGTLSSTDDPDAIEAKFLQIRGLIERFRGRQGSTELDRRWTTKVTDVRNWFVFAASERYPDTR